MTCKTSDIKSHANIIYAFLYNTDVEFYFLNNVSAILFIITDIKF